MSSVAAQTGPANRAALATEYERVRAYYAGFNEWDRLDPDEGRLEFRRAMEIRDRHLLSLGRVLDLGGGPGRYSIELARRGHSVVLADLSPALLAQARERIAAVGVQTNIEAIDEVNAADLSRYSSESFDAVLAFGPFYHLTSEDERVRASHEIARVLRGGGLAFIAFVPRISGIAGLIERAARAPQQVSRAALHLAVETGVFHNTSEAGFQEGYYCTTAEIESLIAAAGLQTIDILSLRSVAYRLERALDALAPSMRAEVDAVIASMSRWPDVVASSGHALLIARKP
jgi:SAM-dependent methyltransferase